MVRYIITAFLGVFIFLSCFEDKGNYDYQVVNEITIGQLPDNYTIAADVGILNIDPQVQMTISDPDDSRFDYYWIVEYRSYSILEPVHILDTIGRERVLNWQANLPIYTYDMRFKIVDRETGLVAQATSTLTLTIYHGRGIMLASEDEQGYFKGQMLVMISGEETVLYEDLLQYSELPALKGAVDFFHTGNTNPESSRAIWLVTDEGTYFVNRMSLKLQEHFNTFNDKFYFPPAERINPIDIGPRINANSGATGGYSNGVRYYLCSNGDVYHNWISIYGDEYDATVNAVQNESGTFKAKGRLFIAQKSMGLGTIVCYDGTNERFLSLGMAATYCKSLTDVAGDAFPWNQSSRTYVYGENTLGGAPNGSSFAIMKENNPTEGYDYCIYEFYATGPAKRAFYKIDRTQAPLFGSATSYAFSSKRTVVFYVADGRLYAYDYDPSVNKNYEIALADNHTVTMAKFDTQREPGLDYLYVATYAGGAAGGTLYKYSLDANLNLVALQSTPTEQWSGLARVKNMSWRGSE